MRAVELRGDRDAVAEEAERAEDAVVGLHQPVAPESGELLQLRDERLVDLAGQLGRPILVGSPRPPKIRVGCALSFVL
jgi:hypothetical protein